MCVVGKVVIGCRKVGHPWFSGVDIASEWEVFGLAVLSRIAKSVTKNAACKYLIS